MSFIFLDLKLNQNINHFKMNEKMRKKKFLSVFNYSINLIFVLFNVYCSCVASFMDTIVFQWRMKLKKNTLFFDFKTHKS